MFKPPIAYEKSVAWADLLRTGEDGDPFWLKVRTGQLGFLSRYLPFNILVAASNSAVVLAALADKASFRVLALWFVLQFVMLLVWVVRQLGERSRGARTPATPKFVRQVTAEMAIVGIAWGLLFADVLPRIDPGSAMLVVAMAMAAVGVTAFTTAIFPLGALALSGPIILGTAYGMASNQWDDVWMILIVVASFLIVTIRGNVLTAFAFLSRMKTQDRLVEQEEMVRLLLNEFEANGSDWLFEFDSVGKLTFASTRFAEAVRRPVEDVTGLHWLTFLTDKHSRDQLFAITNKAQPYRDVLLKVEVESETRWWSLSGTPKFDREGRLQGYRGVGSDVTDQQRAAQRIAELATFDALTGLVNRRIINQTLDEGINSPEGVALLFVDLDRFKAVNDSLGHAAGDRLLADVAFRLREMVGTEGLVGRLGGDEFAVVLRQGDVAAATALGKKIIARISDPYCIDGSQALIGASVGLAVGPEDGDSVEALMRAADLALYDVKGKGRGSVRHYDRAMHKRAEDRRSLELDLKNALGAGQLRMAFQPVVDAIDERIVGFEALMRWRHPVHGDISPAVFIPIAEESGIIGTLGRWALVEGCRVAAAWPRHIKLAVNLSPLQFDDPGLVDHVRQTLLRYNILPKRLELELTESLFLDERPQTSLMLKALHDLGVGFALDDFGTGYSSLGYLQKIAFNRIKIDRSFVQASVAEGGESTAIVQAIVALADKLGMETTAEGTETRAEFEAMRRLGCAHIQGYFFGRPMSADDAARLLDRSRPLVEISDEPAESSVSAPPLPPSLRGGYGQWQKLAAPAIPPLRATPPHTLRG